MFEDFSRILDDELTPDGSLRTARSKAIDLLKLELPDAGTKEAAVYTLSRRYGLGPWLRRLVRGDKVTVHHHLFMRLERALDTKIADAERRVARLKAQKATHAHHQEIQALDSAPRTGGVPPRLNLVGGGAR